MKTIPALALRITLALLLAALAYLWATALMDSIYAYRSPLAHAAPPPGEALARPGGMGATRQLVVALVDGLRLDTALEASVMPVLDGLRRQGAWAEMSSQPPSYSQPGYTTLFTGAWPDISDSPPVNLDYEQIRQWTQDDLFSAAHRAGLSTAISGYNWFEKLAPQTAITVSFYTPGEDQFADRQVVDAVLPWLRQASYQLVLVHLDQVDYAGHHEGGPRDPRWAAAASRADGLLSEIASALDWQQDTLLVVSDHGHIDAGGHGGHDLVTLREPFLLVGAGVRPGSYPPVAMVDVAPTLAALLGISLPASSQGEVRTEMLILPEAVLSRLPGAVQAQQAGLLAAYSAAIGVPLIEPPADGSVTGYQQALDGLRQARLSAERLPRLLLAGAALLLPLAYFLRKGKALWGMLAAALLFLLVFNLRYAWLEGRSYSLSSVRSASDVIVSTLSNAGLALLLAWLLVFLAGRLGRQKPAAAFARSHDFFLLVIYLLALPAAWSYALNGLLVTWTLPHFPSMFLGFLSLLQILVVAAAGLLFSGLAALIARYGSLR